MHFVFVIPLRNKSTCKDWSKTIFLLDRTIKSVTSQSAESSEYSVVVVCKEHPEKRRYSDNVHFVTGDFEDPPSDYDMRLDKYRKIKTGLAYCSKMAPCYVMKVDSDDLVSNHIVRFVRNDDNKIGYYLDKGYVWRENSLLVKKLEDFSRFCGTSHIMYETKYTIPTRPEDNYNEIMLCHNIPYIKSEMEGGYPVKPIPFPGAVYVKHDDNISVEHPGHSRNRNKGFLKKMRMYAHEVRRFHKYRFASMVLSRFGL